MGNGDRAVLGQQKLRHRFADQVGTADDDRRLAGKRVAERPFQQNHAAGRRARQHRAPVATHEPPGIDRMQAVDVLFRPDRLDHRRLVEMRRQRQLHQDAMDRRIGVERLHDRQQVRLAGFRRQRLLHRMEAEFGRLLALAGDIDGARRIVADQHHRQAGHGAGRLSQPRGLALDGLGDFLGNGASVDALGAISGRQRCVRH